VVSSAKKRGWSRTVHRRADRPTRPVLQGLVQVKLGLIWKPATKNFPRSRNCCFDSRIDHRSFPQINLSLQSFCSQRKMASKSFARTALRASKQKVAAPAVPKRSFVSAPASRPVVSRSTRAVAAPIQQQTRGVKTIDFAGHQEQVFGWWSRSSSRTNY